MKTKTTIDIEKYLPAEDEYAFAMQISDLPSSNIARILILQDYSILHSQKRILLTANLIHIDTKTNQNVSHVYNSEIRDWIISNQFFVMLRDESGNMQQNPEYVDEKDRKDGIMYMSNQLQKYLVAPAFSYFAKVFKYLDSSNQKFFENIIFLSDEINNLFDEYKSLTSNLMSPPVEINLNPQLIEEEETTNKK